MCDCLDKALSNVSERVVEKIKNNADLDSLNIGFENKMIRFDGKPNDVMIGIQYSYFKTKANGERYQNRTRDHVSLAMSFCPLCGEKYE